MYLWSKNEYSVVYIRFSSSESEKLFLECQLSTCGKCQEFILILIFIFSPFGKRNYWVQRSSNNPSYWNRWKLVARKEFLCHILRTEVEMWFKTKLKSRSWKIFFCEFLFFWFRTRFNFSNYLNPPHCWRRHLSRICLYSFSYFTSPIYHCHVSKTWRISSWLLAYPFAASKRLGPNVYFKERKYLSEIVNCIIIRVWERFGID